MGTTSSFGLDLNTTGLGLNQGIDVQQTVQALEKAAEAPEQQMESQETYYSDQASAATNINNLLSDLQTAVQTLEDPAGGLDATSATSSNDNVVTATSTAGTQAGTSTVTVTSLATTSTYDTNELASGDTTFGAGQFTIQVGSGSAQTITVDSSNDTLNTLASYINNGNYGVTASVVTDANGARLSLTSDTSGAPGNLTISGNTTGLTFNQTVAGANSSITVNGVPLNTTSNTVTGAIPDVTLNLTGTSTSPVTVTVGADASQASTPINNFVSAYNAVIDAINAQFTYTQGASSQPPLFSDSSLQQVQQTLYNDVNYAISGNSGINSLASLGITLQSDGTLAVNNDTLNSTLSSNPAAVQNFFQQASGTNGFALNFENDLTNLTDTATGPLYLDLQGFNQDEQNLTDQINAFQANVNQEAQLWEQEYAQVNSLLQTLPLQLEQLNSELGNINSNLSTSSSSAASSTSSSSSSS
ncbi:MAG TPA: flagellar filament capping protein FliD [Terriglobia bacterium]|nr:flagellar filament capping protein FliD [Terriglobia bacterium]